MPVNIPAALACASLIFGMPNPHPGHPLTILTSQTVLDRLCDRYAGAAAAAGGCEAAFVVDDGGREYIVAGTIHIPWETQVAEACHVLQYRNGLPSSEAQCHHDAGWARFYRSRIALCADRGITDTWVPPTAAAARD